MNNNWIKITDSIKDELGLLVNAAGNPDFKNSGCLDKEFNCVGFAIRFITLEDGKECPNVILFDEDGNSYSTISAGVYKAICTFRDCGLEPSWEKPVRVRYLQVNAGSFRYYTLKVITNRAK